MQKKASSSSFLSSLVDDSGLSSSDDEDYDNNGAVYHDTSIHSYILGQHSEKLIGRAKGSADVEEKRVIFDKSHTNQAHPKPPVLAADSPIPSPVPAPTSTPLQTPVPALASPPVPICFDEDSEMASTNPNAPQRSAVHQIMNITKVQ